LTLSIFDHTNRVLLLLLKLLVPIPRPLPRSPTKVKGGAVKIVNYSTDFNLTGGESAEQTKGKRAKCLVPPPKLCQPQYLSLYIYIYKIKPMDRGQTNAKRAQRAGISKHIMTINYKNLQL